MVWSVSASEDAAVAEAVDNVGGLRWGRRARGRFAHEVDAEEKASTANFADKSASGLQSPELGYPTSADLQRAPLKMFVAQNIEDSKSGSAGHGIAAKRSEELHAIVEGGGDFGSRDYRGKGKSIADGFTENSDVWNNGLCFKAPEMCPEASETYLDFIGDADTAGCAHMFVNFGQIIRGKHDLTGNAR